MTGDSSVVSICILLSIEGDDNNDGDDEDNGCNDDDDVFLLFSRFVFSKDGEEEEDNWTSFVIASLDLLASLDKFDDEAVSLDELDDDNDNDVDGLAVPFRLLLPCETKDDFRFFPVSTFPSFPFDNLTDTDPIEVLC